MTTFAKHVFTWVALVAILVMGFVSPMTVSAAPVVDQKSCEALAAGYGNVAHPEDSQWVQCFVEGWVNWVFGTEGYGVLPADPPESVKDAMKHDVYLQLTEPWNPGCDNTLMHPDCSIGYLKLFGDWGNLRAFLAHGDFTQAGVTKDGPWSIGSLWMAEGYIQVATGDQMSPQDRDLFCTAAMGLAFANDGEYLIPSSAPCEGANTYYLFEEWRGGGIGDQLPDANVNVGKVTAYSDWGEMVQYLADNNWTRGSVWANRQDMTEQTGIVAAPATATLAPVLPTATLAAAPAATSSAAVPTATINWAQVCAPDFGGIKLDMRQTIQRGTCTYTQTFPISPSFPWWGWMILVLVLVAIYGIVDNNRRRRAAAAAAATTAAANAAANAAATPAPATATPATPVVVGPVAPVVVGPAAPVAPAAPVVPVTVPMLIAGVPTLTNRQATRLATQFPDSAALKAASIIEIRDSGPMGTNKATAVHNFALTL